MHDLIAELNGYRNELASAQRDGKTERAAAVQQQIDRVTGQMRTRVDQLGADAQTHEGTGQDLLAVQARAQARRLADALDAEQAPATQDAAGSTPRETAVTSRRRGRQG